MKQTNVIKTKVKRLGVLILLIVTTALGGCSNTKEIEELEQNIINQLESTYNDDFFFVEPLHKVSNPISAPDVKYAGGIYSQRLADALVSYPVSVVVKSYGVDIPQIKEDYESLLRFEGRSGRHNPWTIELQKYLGPTAIVHRIGSGYYADAFVEDLGKIDVEETKKTLARYMTDRKKREKVYRDISIRFYENKDFNYENVANSLYPPLIEYNERINKSVAKMKRGETLTGEEITYLQIGFREMFRPKNSGARMMNFLVYPDTEVGHVGSYCEGKL